MTINAEPLVVTPDSLAAMIVDVVTDMVTHMTTHTDELLSCDFVENLAGGITGAEDDSPPENTLKPDEESQKTIISLESYKGSLDHSGLIEMSDFLKTLREPDVLTALQTANEAGCQVRIEGQWVMVLDHLKLELLNDIACEGNPLLQDHLLGRMYANTFHVMVLREPPASTDTLEETDNVVNLDFRRT